MIWEDRRGKYDKQKKKALVFPTKPEVTFSKLTRSNIERNESNMESREDINSSQNAIDSEEEEVNGHNTNYQ